MSDNILQLNQEVIHNEIRDLVKASIEETLNSMLDAEADQLVNAERYARDEQRAGYRAGQYERGFTTTAGEVTLKVPKLKGVAFETSIIERYKRRETSVETQFDIQLSRILLCCCKTVSDGNLPTAMRNGGAPPFGSCCVETADSAAYIQN